MTQLIPYILSLITNLGADYEQYRVPNTPTRLLISYRDEQPIDPLAMQRTLLQTQLRLRRYIQSRWRIEDDVLSRSDDPYLSDPGLHGCFFGIGHYPDGPGEPRRLTYRMVENVMKGAWDRIYRRERYVSAHLLVEDDEVGVVGVAGLTKERPVRSMMSMTSAIDF